LNPKSIYNNPPFAILFQSPDPLIGPLSGFQYTSWQLPVFGPAQLQDSNNNIFTIDPPLPGPIMSGAVPEPTTFALSLMGLLSLGMIGRRRGRR
jgi:hypothetical protein